MTPELVGLLAGCRWLLYVTVLAVIGTEGAWFVTTRVRSDPFRAIFLTIQPRLDRLAVVASIVWVLALASTFVAQFAAWFGLQSFGDSGLVHAMLFRTRWGRAWIIAFTSAAVAAAAAGTSWWWASRRALRFLALAAAILTTPLIGHAAGHGLLMWFLHATHLLGTGMWLGTLLMLALTTWAFWRDESRSPTHLRTMLQSFTPVALTGAALTIATGVFMSAEYVLPVEKLLKTDYGRTLMVKIGIVAVVAILGWINWRHLRPAAEITRKRRQLRRVVVAELAIGLFVVLAVTAWLSGLPMPM
jgi:putative copper export protein